MQQPTVTRTGSYNPGKNLKGQQARAKKQHTGPVQMKFIDDKQARAQTLYRRKKTLITKIKELHTTTGTDVYLQWRTDTGLKGEYLTPNSTLKAETTSCPRANQEATPLAECEVSEAQPLPQPSISTIEEPLDTPTATLVNTSLPTRRSARRPEVNKNLCQKCGKEEIVGKKKKMFWLGCEARKCDYWVHASCNGLILKDERQMSSISFYCPEHVKKYL